VLASRGPPSLEDLHLLPEPLSLILHVLPVGQSASVVHVQLPPGYGQTWPRLAFAQSAVALHPHDGLPASPTKQTEPLELFWQPTVALQVTQMCWVASHAGLPPPPSAEQSVFVLQVTSQVLFTHF
jgi:hypothetical protein